LHHQNQINSPSFAKNFVFFSKNCFDRRRRAVPVRRLAMDSPARASASAMTADAVPMASTEAFPIVARANECDDEFDDDDDDEEDEDYVLGNLDASDLEDDSDDEDEDEDEDDHDVSVARSQPEREDIEDSDSDSLSLEDEDFAAIVGAAVPETPRKRRVRGYGDVGAASTVTSARTDEGDPFAGDGAGVRERRSAFSSFLMDDDSRGCGSLVNSPATRAAGAAADMMMFAGLFDDDEEEMVNAIARRTRARTGTIEDTELAELELALPDTEPEFDWLDEGAEYDRFLTELNDPNVNAREFAQEGEGALGTLDDDDDDDDDYVDENPKAAEYEYRLREERRAAVRHAGTSAPPSVVRRSDRHPAPGRPTANTLNLRQLKRKMEEERRVAMARAARFEEAAKAFTPAQITQLNKQMHQHTQLLFQTYSMCASDARRVKVTKSIFVLLTTLQRAGSMQYHRKRVLAKHKSHDGRLFACANEDDPDTCWYGCKPRKGVFTVMDCKPLRCAYNFVTEINAVGFTEPPLVWRDPKDIYESTTTPQETRQLLSAANSYDHVRMDDLFRERPKSWAEIVGSISSLPRNAVKVKTLLKTAVESYAWRPVPRAVYEVTAKFLQKISPDPSLLVRALSTSERASFTPAEDGLIAVGIRHYGDDYGVISRQLLLPWDKKDVAKRARALLTKKYHESTEAGRAARAAYEHAHRPLDENEIEVIQRMSAELNLSKPIESSYCEVKPFWERACARLRDRIPKCVYKLWRALHRPGSDARTGAPRVASRAKTKTTTNGATAPRNAAATNDHGFERETVEDSESDEEAYERDELSDSDCDAPAAPASAVTTAGIASKRVTTGAFTKEQDSAIIACAAFGEDFVSLLKPGAPCERRSIDAVLVRYNQLKAARAANGGAAATTA